MTEPIDPNPSDWYLQQPGYSSPWPVELPPYPAELPAPAEQRSRWTLPAVLISCLVVAAIGVGIFYLVYKPDRPDPLPIPVAFDGYTQISSPTTERLESTMRSMLSGNSAAFDSATIGFYSHNTGDAPRLIIVVFPAAVFPGTADETTESIQSDLGVLAADLAGYPPGPRGGKSLCGPLEFDSVPEQLCAWVDGTSAGVMVSVAQPMTPVQLAQIERDFRSRLPR